MKSLARLVAGGNRRAISALLASAFAVSCTVTSGPGINTAGNSFTSGGTPTIASVLSEAEAELSAEAAADKNGSATPAGTQPQVAVAAEAPAVEQLPTEVAYLPQKKPGGAAAEALAAEKPAVPEATVQPEAASKPQATATVTAAAPEAPASKPTAFLESGPGPAPAPQDKKRGFLASLFSSQPAEETSADGTAAKPAPKPTAAESSPQKPKVAVSVESEESEPAAKKKSGDKPLLQLASTGSSKQRVFDDSGLPGVRQSALFEITRKSGLDDDSDIDLHEDEEPMQLASAAGLARLAPNGLLKQTESVDVGCLKPSLVRALKTIEQHYGKKMVVTSGYRSPSYNRKVRGARKSYHMHCAAADVQIPGVSKWDLAQFVRTMPGRGGVGTYCHTNSIHIDVGPERDWNWRCRRGAS